MNVYKICLLLTLNNCCGNTGINKCSLLFCKVQMKYPGNIINIDSKV